MITGYFSYVCQSVEEFKACCEMVRLANVNQGASLTVDAPDTSERGPYEAEYIKRMGQQRFKLSAMEKARVDGGVSREQIAKERLDALAANTPRADISPNGVPVESEENEVMDLTVVPV